MARRKYILLRRSIKNIIFFIFPIFLLGGTLFGVKDKDNLHEIVNTFNFVAILIYAFSTSRYFLPLIKERETKISQVLKVMGLRSAPYCMANMSIDAFFGLLTTSVVTGIAILIKVPILGESPFLFFLNTLLFILGVIVYGYCLSYSMVSVATGAKILPMALFCGFIIGGVLEIPFRGNNDLLIYAKGS